MKQKIHPKYYTDATVTCNGCGTTHTIGSTKEKLTVELCSNCHPFYTGKQKLVDTAGRVDRYRARAAKAAKGEARSRPEQAKRDPGPPGKDSGVRRNDKAELTPEERLAKMKSELTDNKQEQ